MLTGFEGFVGFMGTVWGSSIIASTISTTSEDTCARTFALTTLLLEKTMPI